MNKKTLLLILIVPFLIALLGFTNVILIKNFVEVDISDINWKYNDNEGFKVSKTPYLLEAEAVVPEGLNLSEGNDLMWYLDEESDICEIQKQDTSYYLLAKKEGEVKINCSNIKKTKTKSFNATIYENGAIIINPLIKSSGYSVTNKRYYGEYDIKYDEKTLDPSSLNKVGSTIEFKIDEYGDNTQSTYTILEKSSNIELEIINSSLKVNVLKEGKASFTLRSNANTYLKSTYTFDVIEEGINVYNYLDLLMCTNKSKEGEIVCLQVSLESKDNTFNKDNTYKANNVRLFGNESGLNFKNEVYTFDSTYNTNFIHQTFGEDTTYDDVITGIHVQKDFYGNGFIINGKELTYPNNGKVNEYSGKLEPGENDLFKGPLTFFSIGKFKAPIMKAFGQDNSLMYISKDNVTVNDLIIECTDKFNNTIGGDTSTNNMYNLEYTGTVIDVNAKNVTIKNSELRNGRTALRVYSSPNFTLKNSLLSTAREFLMKLGNNEYNPIDLDQNIYVYGLKKVFNGKLNTFLTNHLDNNLSSSTLGADELVTKTFFQNEGTLSNDDYKALLDLQSFLNNDYLDELKNVIYGQEVNIIDSYFYRSGIYSIAFDTYFNGPFLFNGIPSFIEKTFNSYFPGLLEKMPDNISGTMKPTLLNIKGDTRFYDWKDIDSIDASCLIEERLGDFIASIPDFGDKFGDIGRIEIDSYFPMKSLLLKEATTKSYIYKVKNNDEMKNYLNTSIAYYGGGSNLSSVNLSEIKTSDFGDLLDVNILYSSLYENYSDNMFSALLAKCVPIASGFNNFKFYTNGTIKENEVPYLFNEVPSKNDFISRT